MRTVSVDLEEILSLVHCSESYGWCNSTLMAALADFAGAVTDEDIEEYAAVFLTDEYTEQGYSEEDYEEGKRVLTEWRDQYGDANG